MRGPSTWSVGERELMATLVAKWNSCTFCAGAHGAVVPIAIPAMRHLAHRKIAIAEKIGSRALRADAMEAATCGWLSFVVVESGGSMACRRLVD